VDFDISEVEICTDNAFVIRTCNTVKDDIHSGMMNMGSVNHARDEDRLRMLLESLKQSDGKVYVSFRIVGFSRGEEGINYD
jgi:hypothetical protein